MTVEHEQLGLLTRDTLLDKLTAPFDAAVAARDAHIAKVGELVAKPNTQVAKVITALNSGVEEGRRAVEAAAGAGHEIVTQAKDKLGKAIADRTAYFSGELVDVPNARALNIKAPDALTKSFAAAEEAAAKVTQPARSHFGIVKTQKGGLITAAKTNVDKMNVFKAGLQPMDRAKAFGRSSVLAGSAVLVGDALFRSKDSMGEDRSKVFRVCEAIVGGGVGLASLLHGSAIAR